MSNAFITAIVLALIVPLAAFLSKRYRRLRQMKNVRSEVNIFDCIFVLCVVLSFASGMVGFIDIAVDYFMKGTGA